MTRRSIIVGVLGKGWSGTSRGLSLAGQCWSSDHLVQCGPDEPSWSWTQIWVQARMPDYSLNWTSSSAIQGGQRCQCCLSPTRWWPSRSWGLSYIFHCHPPDRTWHKVNDPKVDYIGGLGEGMVGQKLRLEPCWSMLVIDPLSGPDEPSWSWTQIWGLGTYAWL